MSHTAHVCTYYDFTAVTIQDNKQQLATKQTRNEKKVKNTQSHLISKKKNWAHKLLIFTSDIFAQHYFIKLHFFDVQKSTVRRLISSITEPLGVLSQMAMFVFSSTQLKLQPSYVHHFIVTQDRTFVDCRQQVSPPNPGGSA